MLTKFGVAVLFATGISAECTTEYMASCGSVDDCCAPMSCWNGGNPWHCQIGCFFDFQCKTKEVKELYGDMYCGDLDVYGGFCRHTASSDSSDALDLSQKRSKCLNTYGEACDNYDDCCSPLGCWGTTCQRACSEK